MAIKAKRLNIYVEDPHIRRQIKMLAAKKDISISEYCLKAITKQLAKEIDQEEPNSLKTAIKRAKNFQKKTFKGKVFSISSAELIRESRKSRAKS